MAYTPKQTLDDLLPMRSFWWLIESAPDGIVIVDDRGRILLANAQAERLFGYVEDELLEQPIEVLVPERFRDKHTEHRSHYAAEPRTRPMGIGLELYGLRRDGSEFPVEISLSPVQTKKGLLAMAIVRDITDHKREHFISQTLQKAMLSPMPEVFDRLQIASAYRSAHAGALVGGDFFDVFTVSPELTGIALGDVSGKGIEAAIYAALAKYSLRACAYEDPVPSSVVGRLNNTVYRQSGPEMFITLLYGVLNARDGTLCFTNAGQMPPLYLAAAGHEAVEIDLYGLPLGVLPDTSYEQRVRELKSGDRVLLYSDGVTDARDGRGFYGIERLAEFFRDGCSEPLDEFIARLAGALEEWSGDRLKDDIAVLVLSME